MFYQIIENTDSVKAVIQESTKTVADSVHSLGNVTFAKPVYCQKTETLCHSSFINSIN